MKSYDKKYGKGAYKRRSRSFRPGYDRTSGLYGRFAGSGGTGAELKFFDTTVDQGTVSSVGVVVNSLNLIPQNTTQTGRIGRKCTIKSIQWNYQVSLGRVDDAMNPAPGDTLRMILYQDKQCNGATIVGTDLLLSSIHSFKNLTNSNRFIVLCDKLVNVNYTAVASDTVGFMTQPRVTKMAKWYKRVNIPLEFSGIAGAIIEIRSNNLGVLLITTNGLCNIDSIVRLRFADP